MSVRKSIRDRVSGALNGATNWATKGEWTPRPIAEAQAEGGHVVVNTPLEVTDYGDGQFSATPARLLTVTVEGHYKSSSSISPANRLDGIAEEIEQKVYAASFSDLCQPPELVSTSFGMNDDSDKPHGVVTMEFLFRYYAQEGVPETPII